MSDFFNDDDRQSQASSNDALRAAAGEQREPGGQIASCADGDGVISAADSHRHSVDPGEQDHGNADGAHPGESPDDRGARSVEPIRATDFDPPSAGSRSGRRRRRRASADTPGRGEHGRLRRRRTIAAIAALATAALVWVGTCAIGDRGPPPPRFLSRSGAASFAEMMAEPPTFIYGSSIHVWVYDKANEQPAEIAVTGHADSSTCGRASGAFLNAMLEKTPDREDLFVAGAGRLVRHDDAARRAALAQRAAVQRFIALDQEMAEARFALQYAEDGHVQSGSAAPSETVLRERLAAVGKELEVVKQDADVVAFQREVASGSAFATLVREATRLNETSGLLQVHHLPAWLADAVRARVAKAAAAGTPTTVAFTDLLAQAKVDEAVVFVDMLRAGTAMPLAFEIPAAALSSAAFQQAVANNRKGVEYAMIGDAKDRRQFYKKQLSKFDDDTAGCRELTARERAETIVLNQTCTADGVCFASDHPITVAHEAYCDTVIPKNIALVRSWDENTSALLRELMTDTASGGARIDQMNHGTMIDSLLRDWALPLSHGQNAFDEWRAELRRPTWATIRAALAALHVDVSAVSGEHIVFSANIEGDNIVIRPVHVVDLARAVVVIDPRMGATRVEDAWAKRELVRSAEAESANARRERAVAQVDRALDLAMHGHLRDADAALHQAFSVEASAAASRFEDQFQAFVRDDRADVMRLRAKIRPILRSAGLSTAIEQLRDNERDLVADVQRLRALTRAYPEAPVELHLRLALELAKWIMYAEANPTGTGNPGADWAVVEALSLGDAPADAYRGPRIAVKRVLGEDPGDVIRNGIELIATRAPDYLAAARKARGFPEQSSGELDKLVGPTATLSLFETEAIAMEKLQQSLTHAASASRAAEDLVASSSPDLHAVLRNLDEASTGDVSAPLPLIKSAQERVQGFLSNRYQPDTLARMETASSANRARDQMIRFSNATFDSEYVWLRGLRDHVRLGARARYEAGDYGAALDMLFPSTVAVALAAPALSWEVLAGDWIGSADRIRTRDDGSALIVEAIRSGRLNDVLRLSGLDEPDRRALATRIAAAPWPNSGRGRVSDQVLMLEIPVIGRATAFRGLALGSSRLAVLRAMVYGCAPPARDLVPLSGRCIDSTEGQRYDRVDGGSITGVRVPPLEAVRATAYLR